jgi:hypothetical protein
VISEQERVGRSFGPSEGWTDVSLTRRRGFFGCCRRRGPTPRRRVDTPNLGGFVRKTMFPSFFKRNADGKMTICVQRVNDVLWECIAD